MGGGHYEGKARRTSRPLRVLACRTAEEARHVCVDECSVAISLFEALVLRL